MTHLTKVSYVLLHQLTSILAFEKHSLCPAGIARTLLWIWSLRPKEHLVRPLNHASFSKPTGALALNLKYNLSNSREVNRPHSSVGGVNRESGGQETILKRKFKISFYGLFHICVYVLSFFCWKVNQVKFLLIMLLDLNFGVYLVLSI